MTRIHYITALMLFCNFLLIALTSFWERKDKKISLKASHKGGNSTVTKKRTRCGSRLRTAHVFQKLMQSAADSDGIRKHCRVFREDKD